MVVDFPAAPPRFYAEDTPAPKAVAGAKHPVNDTLALVESACDLGWRRACEVRLAKLVRRGLGDRVQCFRIVRVHPHRLPKHQRRVKADGSVDNKAVNAGHTAVLALLLDEDEAFRQLDRGPPSSDAAAVKKFRLFWGSKAKLRRFKDGSILETVMWGENEVPLRLIHRLPKTILEHLLRRHFQGCSSE